MDLRLQPTIKSSPSVRMNAKKYSAAELVALVIFIILFGWFLILPKRGQISAEQTQLTALQSQQSHVQQTLNTVKLLEQQVKSQTSEESNLDQALPLTYSFSSLPELIQSLGSSVGVTVANVSFSPSEQSPDSGNVPLLTDMYSAQRNLQEVNGSINVTGNFNQIDAFLQKLETNGRVINVPNITISGVSNTTNSMNLKLQVVAYYFAP